MSWVTIIWSMDAAVCLTLAGIHLVVWFKSRRSWGHLFFAFSAVGAAAVAACELMMMRADTPERYAAVLWWTQIPLWVLVVFIAWFSRFHLRAGRPWLAWTVTGARTLTLLLNFLVTPNINYSVIYDLHRIPFLGESIALPVGTVHPLGFIAKLSSLLLWIFLINVFIEVLRRGDRRLDAFLSGIMVVFVTAATVQTILVERGIVQAPYLIAIGFLGVILTMSYGLSLDVMRASQLVVELQASQEGLRESEERMTLAAEAANLGIWISDLARQEVWGTAGWRALFGFGESEPIRFSDILERMHPEDREGMRQMLTRVASDGGSYDTEYRLLLPDGKIRWIASRGRVESSNGKPAILRGVSVDVTRRHLDEFELRQQRAELAHFSRVSMLGELSGSLAHELNQPLGAILRNTEAAELFLQDPSPDLEELRAILADIRKDDQRAGAVIDRMRSMMKRRQVDNGQIDLSQLVGEVVGLVRPDADLRKVQLIIEPHPALTPASGDRIQIQQVLLNLLLNAMDAVNDVEPHRRRVTVRLKQAGGRIEVSVSDTGPGIPAEKMARLFEPFFTTKQNGIGLGLPISRTIMEAHGGSIRAENDPDGGASFCFTLPVAKQGSAS